MITATDVRRAFSYDPLTGEVRRLYRVKNMPPGFLITGKQNRGYIRVFFMGKRHLLHRLIWLHVTGQWPTEEIDHKDRNRANNKWKNLRPANQKQNAENLTQRANTRSGVRGVAWNGTVNKWVAYINHFGKRIHLGCFESIAAAKKIRRAAELEMFTHA